MIRLWNQSIGELEHQPAYALMLAEHGRAVLGPDVELDIRGVASGTYGPDTSPIKVLGSHLGSFLANVQLIESAIGAERDGYDAVVIGCFADPALREVRSAVSIPVVAACEAALMTASMVGEAIGLVGIGPANVATTRELTRLYGYVDRVVDVLPLPTAVSEHEIESAFGSDGGVIASFETAARELVARGADVLIPADNVLNTVLVKRGLRTVDGVPVIDGYANVLALAEMQVRLQRATGLRSARTVHPELSPEGLDRLRVAAIAALRASTRTTTCTTRSVEHV